MSHCIKVKLCGLHPVCLELGFCHELRLALSNSAANDVSCLGALTSPVAWHSSMAGVSEQALLHLNAVVSCNWAYDLDSSEMVQKEKCQYHSSLCIHAKLQQSCMNNEVNRKVLLQMNGVAGYLSFVFSTSVWVFQ